MNGQIFDDMHMQMRFQVYITKEWFSDCVNDFRAAELSSAEKKCLANCALARFPSWCSLGKLRIVSRPSKAAWEASSEDTQEECCERVLTN